jgi:hypothetical protein
MKTVLATTGRAAVLLLPTGMVAMPDKAEKRGARAQCRAERGKSRATRKAFKATYDGFAHCMRRSAAERSDIRRAAFAEKHGKHWSGRNAFGTHVSRGAEGV